MGYHQAKTRHWFLDKFRCPVNDCSHRRVTGANDLVTGDERPQPMREIVNSSNAWKKVFVTTEKAAHLMREKLPELIVSRPKQGYLSSNDDPFLTVNFKGQQLFTEILSDKMVQQMGYFEPQKGKQALVQANQRHNDQKYVDSTIMFILSTHLLHLLFVEGITWRVLCT